MAEPDNAESAARLILLGASNLAKCSPLIVETARHLLGSPLDVYFAMGHGRSYGWKSFLLVRSLPSTLDSGLWNRIENEPAAPTYGLITDIGNDIMYGASAEQIAAWVTECVDRLEAMNARIIITGLPMKTVEQLHEWHFLAARTLFFPTKRITFPQAKKCARTVNETLQELAQTRGIPFVPQPAEWYGLDPIHPMRRMRPRIWANVLLNWTDREQPLAPTPPSLGLSRRVRLSSPEQWWLLGLPRGRSQPSVTLEDGTRIGLY